MGAALGLFRLQRVDSRMDEIRARLNEIRLILENDAEIRQAKVKIEETGASHKSSLHDLNQAEAEVEKQKIKIEQSEASLYSGTIKNPKELQDIQNEAASLKRYLETLEDRQLEAMLLEDETEQEHQTALHELEQVQNRLADQNQSLNQEKRALDKEFKRLEAERKAALSSLDPDLLAVYEQLRLDKRGIAVIEVSDGACGACGTTLTPSQNQSARSTTQIFNCPTCGRILFAS